MLLTILSFLFAIGLLVTVHEFGHYWVAKKAGVKVLKFSIGFGKPLLTWRSGETQWQIAVLPLGGFVQMLGEDSINEVPVDVRHRAFDRQHPLKKIAIVLAGPFANLLLACLLYALAYMTGIHTIYPVINQIAPGSLAEQSDIKVGDKITRFGSHEILDWEDLRIAALSQVGQGQDVDLQLQHNGQDRSAVLRVHDFSTSSVDAQVLSRLGLSPLALDRVIDAVQEGSAAAKAGLQAEDTIIAINGITLDGWQSMQAMIERAPSQQLLLQVKRADQLLTLEATPDTVQSEHGLIGRLGISPRIDQAAFDRQKFILQLGLAPALAKGVDKAWRLSVMSLQMMGRMLTNDLSPNNVSGPIGIAKMAGQSASLGVAVYLQFLALVSLSLGVLNLLPVPVLDGGHFLYHSAELVRGRPLPQSWMQVGQKLGIVLLVGLMLLAFYNDINRIITG